MELTLVFERNEESTGGNYNLVFEPCPIWADNNEWLINLNPETPLYLKGSLQKLIEKVSLQKTKRCIVVAHNYGHGDGEVLKVLKEELEELGIKYRVVNLGEL